LTPLDATSARHLQRLPQRSRPQRVAQTIAGIVTMMQIVPSLASLPPCPALAVIINCSTKWTTTLTLASALEHAGLPILLIDCESNDGSREHFARLASQRGLDFRWLEWPLRRHGLALDALCADIRAESVLLIDSDLEILAPRIVTAMKDALAGHAQAYGSGLLHGPAWLGAEHGLPAGVGYYARRMWIPLVLLRTAPIRAALRNGVSFAQRRAFGEIPRSPTLSRWLAYRFWVPGLRRWQPKTGGGTCDERSAAFIEYDTGADMHEALCAMGYRFAALDVDTFGGDVHHYHGMSRAAMPHVLRKAGRRLGLRLRDNSTPEAAARNEIRRRLADRYGIAQA
jgi:hypothetical protein